MGAPGVGGRDMREVGSSEPNALPSAGAAVICQDTAAGAVCVGRTRRGDNFFPCFSLHDKT